jgi:hypothetical protein
MAVQVALVEEPGARRGLADPGAALEHAPRELDALGDLEAVWRHPDRGREQPHDAEAADPGRRGELVERDVSREIVREELARAREDRIGPRGAPRSELVDAQHPHVLVGGGVHPSYKRRASRTPGLKVAPWLAGVVRERLHPCSHRRYLS